MLHTCCFADAASPTPLRRPNRQRLKRSAPTLRVCTCFVCTCVLCARVFCVHVRFVCTCVLCVLCVRVFCVYVRARVCVGRAGTTVCASTRMQRAPRNLRCANINSADAKTPEANFCLFAQCASGRARATNLDANVFSRSLRSCRIHGPRGHPLSSSPIFAVVAC